MISNSSILTVRDYQVYVSLGCTQEEQTITQPVLFTCEIIFSGPESLNFEKTDQLQDAIDYVEVCLALKRAATRKSHQLIEHLGRNGLIEIIEVLKRKNSSLHGIVKLTSVKVRPPVEGLLGGVSWTCHANF